MANKTYAVHTSEENIRRLDQHAEQLRRSRNSLLNEAIEMWLEHYDKAVAHDTWKKAAIIKYPRKKAGAR